MLANIWGPQSYTSTFILYKGAPSFGQTEVTTNQSEKIKCNKKFIKILLQMIYLFRNF